MQRFVAFLIVAIPSLAHADPPAAASTPSGHGVHHQMHEKNHRFDDAKKWSAIFDDPARDAWQKPVEVVAALQLKPTDTVCDVGAGTGYFLAHLSRAVPQGKVVGIDIEPTLIAHMKERIQKAALKNADAQLSTATDSNVVVGSNVVLIVDTYHHIDNRVAYFAAMKDKLAVGGRVAIIDFNLTTERGPPKAHRIPVDQIDKEMTQAGFKKGTVHTFLPDQIFAEYVRP